MAGAVAILIVVVGLVTRVMASREVDDWTEANALPTVSVINLQSGANGHLALPGSVQAFNSSPIYARVSGYLKKWYVDIGDQGEDGDSFSPRSTSPTRTSNWHKRGRTSAPPSRTRNWRR